MALLSQKADKDLNFDKINLIYEFNKESPLFSRVAAIEIERNNFEKALQILEEGINNYPEYPTPKLIMAKLLAHLGRIDEARELIRRTCNQIDSESSFNYYESQIDKIEQKRKEVPSSKRTKFISDNFEENLDEQLIYSADSEDYEPSSNNIEENLENLAEQVSNAKIDQNTESMNDVDTIKDFRNNLIVSETLAGIYFAQGNLKESLYIYERLIEEQPEKSDFFKKKVIEIQELLEKK